MNMKNISVIIPCHNEAETIAKVINKVPSMVEEIIVIDNNSSDETANIALQAGAKVVPESKQGYGSAIRRGFREARGDIIVVLDGDDQYPADKITELTAYLVDNNLDFVSAARFPLQDKKSLPHIRKFGNLVFNFITNFLFGTHIKDSQSGMWIFKREVLDTITLESESMSLSEEIKLRVIDDVKLSFAEYPISYAPRISPSKLLPWQHGWANLKYLFKLKRELIRKDSRPILFFLGVVLIVTMFVSLASLHINTPFFHVTADVNGENGVAAMNIVNNGAWKMKFGAYNTNLVSEPIKGSFYTHHPAGYLWPTVMTYRLFGVSEASTRLGPLIFMLFGLWAFAYGMRKVFYPNIVKPLVILGVFAILPGVVFYGETFELAIFALPAAFILWSLFVSWTMREDKMYLKLFLFYVVLGGLIAWFFYLMVFVLWLITLFNSKLYGRRQILIYTPLMAIFGLILNLLHFYWLNGNFFPDLIASLFTRVARPEAFYLWFLRIEQMAKFHFTSLFIILAFLGLFIFLMKRFTSSQERRYFWPWFIFPTLVFLIFSQWSTHPFGVIFLAPLVAILAGWLLFNLVIFIKSKTRESLSAILILAIVLVAGLGLSVKQLDYFFNDFAILAPADLELIQSLKTALGDQGLCLGRNDLGINIGGIIEWNLQQNINNAPNCFTEKNNFALIFNPRFSTFYLSEAQLFLNNGFLPVGCSGNLCLLEKK